MQIEIVLFLYFHSKYHFFASFLACFIDFGLFTLARISSIMLNRSGESGPPSHVPDLGEKFFNPMLVWLLVVCLLYQIEEVSFFLSLLNIFVRCLFCVHWDNHVIHVLCSMNIELYIFWFGMLKPCIPGINTSGSCCIIISICCAIQFFRTYIIFIMKYNLEYILWSETDLAKCKHSLWHLY